MVSSRGSPLLRVLVCCVVLCCVDVNVYSVPSGVDARDVRAQSNRVWGVDRLAGCDSDVRCAFRDFRSLDSCIEEWVDGWYFSLPNGLLISSFPLSESASPAASLPHSAFPLPHLPWFACLPHITSADQAPQCTHPLASARRHPAACTFSLGRWFCLVWTFAMPWVEAALCCLTAADRPDLRFVECGIAVPATSCRAGLPR